MAQHNRFKLTAPEPSELEIHIACVNLLERILLPPAQFNTLEAGHYKLSPAETARQRRLRVQSAWPDILLVWQGIWGIEVKTINGHLSKTVVKYDKRGNKRVIIGQEDRFPLLKAAGFRDIAIVTSTTDLLARLNLWKIPHRRTLNEINR